MSDIQKFSDAIKVNVSLKSIEPQYENTSWTGQRVTRSTRNPVL